MRISILLAGVFSLVTGLPAPQDIDLEYVAEQPDPTYTIDVIGAASQVVTYDAVSIAAEITAGLSAVSIAVSDVATSINIAKRTAGACASLPAGATGAPSMSSDSASAFAANPTFVAIASSASTPSGYKKTFTNSNASALSYGFLGFSSLDTYDPQTCSQSCDTTPGCMGFNICFTTVIAGSNAYVKTAVIGAQGYSQPVNLGASAINAPYDAQGYNTYMGFKLFTTGVFNISLCAAYCDAQTVYNVAHPPSDKSPAQKCHFFNTYILYKNSASNVQGQYCVIYSEVWNQSYATNTGSWYGSDHYMIDASYTAYSLADQGPSPVSGDRDGAIGQASKEITWSKLQPYCSALVGNSGSGTPLSVPAGLAKYPASVVDAACSLQVTSAQKSASSSGSSQSSSFIGSSMLSVSAVSSGSSTVSSFLSSSSSALASSSALTGSSANTFSPAVTSTSSSISSTLSSSPSVTTSSHPLSGAGLGFVVTVPTSLNSLAMSYYTQMTSGIKYNSQGTISGSLKDATKSSTFPAVTADLSDNSAQPSLRAQLQNVGLPSFDATVQDVQSALDNALGANTTSDDGGDYENWFSSDDSPVTNMTERGTSRLSKRITSEEFWNGVDTWVCNDLVTSLSEKIEAACKVKEGVEAIVCLANNCLDKAASPPPPVEYPFDQSYSFSLQSYKNQPVFSDGVSELRCADCAMDVSNLRIRGTIVINMQTSTVVSSTMTLNQDSVQRFSMGITTLAASKGSWSHVWSAQPFGGVTAPGVFTVSPSIYYGIGATWSTNGQTKFDFSSKSTMSGASVEFDAVGGYTRNEQNWAPTLDVSQPVLYGQSATLIPFTQSSIQIGLSVLGNNIPNAIVVNSQVSLGFTSNYVTMAKLGHTKCGAGQLQSSTYNKIVNTVNLQGQSHSLFSFSRSTAPVCSDASIDPPSSFQIADLQRAAGAGSFCSSFIKYQPATVNVTSIKTVIKATSTGTVIGSGTTTITPSALTSTVVVTSSVSTYPSLIKRFVPASTANSQPDLVARRVVPTPTILSTWIPQQVSAACLYIATGLAQATITQSLVVSSGVTTVTAQATVTAAVPTTTITSTLYVPAATPYELVSNSKISSDPAQAMEWSFTGGAINSCRVVDVYSSRGKLQYVSGQKTVCDPATMQLAGSARSGSYLKVLTDLEPGWPYNFTLWAGFSSTTDTCNVSYYLDDALITTYSPTNTDTKPADPTVAQIIYAVVHGLPAPVASVGFKYLWNQDGPYQVVPTKSSQTLKITMTCLQDGGYAEFGKVSFNGPGTW
ncbi:hypothetical protein E4T42_04679 [Aureobasidium subglaciale]|nr:hypothetical protein E4T38_08993 [Aureobasidium subglaciale]KAI5214551.1 hypothetical protein E4T40_08953 [Aureobasidium subglaciale]KAI5217278.1 hypothetical protein E4T41_08912 [Aureobasidium subglaciale]KAI5250990.1 hypothetical protein E4T42_04679 [Aureobasidium subglaciale]KAI5255021.1 hypothetical protein E4T46_08946 [Aureobasidium subglaciale]